MYRDARHAGGRNTRRGASVIARDTIERWSKAIDLCFVALTLWQPILIPLCVLQFLIRRWPFACEGLLDLFGVGRLNTFWLILFPGAIGLLMEDPAERLSRAMPHAQQRESVSISIPVPPPARGSQPVMRMAALQAPAQKGSIIDHLTWYEQVNDNPVHVPHMLVIGGMGSGKSALMEAFTKGREGQSFIIQPNRKIDEWLNVPVVQCDDDGGYADILLALQAWMAEFKRRGGAMKVGDPGPWLTLVWDEIPLCIHELGDYAKDVVFKTISAGRPRNMRLLGGSTNHRVEAVGLGGYGDLLQAVAVIHLGAYAINDCPELEKTAWPTTLLLAGPPQPVMRGPVQMLIARSLDSLRLWYPASVPSVPDDEDAKRTRRCDSCNQRMTPQQWSIAHRHGCKYCGGEVQIK